MMKLLTAFVLLLFSATGAWAQRYGSNQGNRSKPFVLGVIDEIPSKILHEKRILNIYLPEGYKADDSARYPVVYLLDGSANEDFIHIVGLYQFCSFPWVDFAPKSIVVGIANVDRIRDFTFPTTIPSDRKRFPQSGHSDKFIAFIEKELQPYIEKRYRTDSSRTLIGESLGGLLATEILFEKPALFNKYIIVSPSIWWDNGSILKKSLDKFKTTVLKGTQIYIGVGKEGLTPTTIPRVMEVDANLLFEKIKKTKSKKLSVYFDYLPDENHATIMHQAVYNALKWLHTSGVQRQ